MAEPTDPQEATPSPDNTHWGVAYLREDLQDLRQQMREDNKDLRQQMAETNQRIDGINESLGQRIDSRFAWSITTMVALAGILIAVIKL